MADSVTEPVAEITIEPPPARRNLLDLSFHVGLLLKGLFAAGEVLAGIGLAFVTPDRLNRFIDWVTGGQVSEDPNDWLMNRLIEFGHSFSLSTQHFGMFYLLSHGLVKLVVIILLWKKQLWAYPLSILVFIGFIVYQMLRFTSTHSILLVLLTLLDIVMIILTVLEYRKIKAERLAEMAATAPAA